MIGKYEFGKVSFFNTNYNLISMCQLCKKSTGKRAIRSGSTSFGGNLSNGFGYILYTSICPSLAN